MTNRRCVARFCGGPALYRGVACDVHWEILTPDALSYLNAWLDRRHPRGGGASTIPEALHAVSYAGEGIVRQEWRALLEGDVADGLYDDCPEVVAAVRGRAEAEAIALLEGVG